MISRNLHLTSIWSQFSSSKEILSTQLFLSLLTHLLNLFYLLKFLREIFFKSSSTCRQFLSSFFDGLHLGFVLGQQQTQRQRRTSQVWDLGGARWTPRCGDLNRNIVWNPLRNALRNPLRNVWNKKIQGVEFPNRISSEITKDRDLEMWRDKKWSESIDICYLYATSLMCSVNYCRCFNN